jgi:hypothetical protein
MVTATATTIYSSSFNSNQIRNFITSTFKATTTTTKNQNLDYFTAFIAFIAFITAFKNCSSTVNFIT